MVIEQLDVRLYTLKTINRNTVRAIIEDYIVRTLARNKEMLQIHLNKGFKSYSYGWLQPVERSGTYEAGKIYTFRLRTIDPELAKFFRQELPNTVTESFKGLVCDSKTLPEKYIEKLYSITPVILKTEDGYFKTHHDIQYFEQQIKFNLFKKCKNFVRPDIDESEPLFNMIQFNNHKPIATPYKNIRLLGDKVTLGIEPNPTAQFLAHMALGTGIGTMNSQGFGFCGFKY